MSSQEVPEGSPGQPEILPRLSQFPIGVALLGFRFVLPQGGVGVVQALDLGAPRWSAHQILALADGIDGDAFGGGVDATSEFHAVAPNEIAGA